MKEEEIYKLHQKYAFGKNKEISLDLVWNHSLIVKDIALQLVKNLTKKNIKINKKMVEIGALVHDIGCYDYYEDQKNVPYILHGVNGYEILKKEGFGEEICRMAMVHLGVGIVRENIITNNLPLEHKDIIPITLEEELVAYADNFHSKAGPRFLDFVEARQKLTGLWIDSPIIFDRFKKKFGDLEIKKLKIKYDIWQKEMREKRKEMI